MAADYIASEGEYTVVSESVEITVIGDEEDEE